MTPFAFDRVVRRGGGHLFELAVGLAIVVLVAAFTHLVAILLIPRVATQDAYDILSKQGGTNRMTVLPPTRPGDKLVPFRDPATVQGLCFYDVTKAPVRVRTRTEDGQLLTLSFRTPDGKVFYSMTDRAAFQNMIDIRLVTASQLETIEDNENDTEQEEVPTELRLKVPALRGLMVATALIARPSEKLDAVRRIAAVTCAPEPLSPPS